MSKKNGTRNGARPIVDFGKLESIMPIPGLLDVQRGSFNTLIGEDKDVPEKEKGHYRLERVFTEIFPIWNVTETLSLEYVPNTIELEEPKYTAEQCLERDMTYKSSIKATLRLCTWEKPKGRKRGPKVLVEAVEKEVYLGDLPLLTELGTFVISGAERVVVSQLHRSPGVVFEETVHPNGTKLHKARIIPFRGSWVEFTIDINDVCYVHIDKKKKFPATALLRAFGYGTNSDIYGLFFDRKQVKVDEDLEGSVIAENIPNPGTGEIEIEDGSELDEEKIDLLQMLGREMVNVYRTDHPNDDKQAGRPGESPIIRNTIQKDPTKNDSEEDAEDAGEEHALKAIYVLLRPGNAPSLKAARNALESVFFDPKRYDLGRVGRYKINQRLGLDDSIQETVLTRDDFVAILAYLIDLSEGRNGTRTDDIDHLGNRRVRTVGELVANQFSIGLSRMARLVRERMSVNSENDEIAIDDLINARTMLSAISAFFGSSQLSQFMDQTNPLAEMTHKRRLSALGPGGLTRERAGFEVRDVHYSHYGRMCPIETPEGPNVGLITSLTTYARVNDLGFVETPYRKVIDGRVTDDIKWLSANEEQEVSIAQANAPLVHRRATKKRKAGIYFRNPYVLCRQQGDFPQLPPSEIEYIDVSPNQLVSVAAAMIPFLEHDDANRALMGSNMQRQAVPLLFTDAPLVGTGLERKVARDTGAVVLARRDGKVTEVTADEIVIDTGVVRRTKKSAPLAKLARYDHYHLKKFWRTNQDTAINQRPLVQVGQKVAKDDVIADGASTDHGELALGRNVRVAFMPWFGYNFEDAIVISERLVRDDKFTSIHIQELELQVRDTRKRGIEEITREIPNVSEDDLLDLDDRGIIRVGARVEAGDILVGKITPKGETELSPEEKLLTAIFGEKAKDVKDSSLRMPTGMSGTVIDVKIFSRRMDDPLMEREHGAAIGELRQEEKKDIRRIVKARDEELHIMLRKQTVALCLKRGTVDPLLDEGTKIEGQVLRKLRLVEVDLATLKISDKTANRKIRELINTAQKRIELVRERTEEQIDKVFRPDEDLQAGVEQLVKVYIAEKRKISVGDKMAGRHGNKGIIAKIVPEEDMPYLPDGTPVEIVLSPLGVPSRMNVGQILETHLGWAADNLGFEAKTPVFHGAKEDEIALLLKLAGIKWAAEALGSGVPWSLDSNAYKDLLAVAKSHPDFDPRTAASSSSNGDGAPNGGLGKSFDEYLALKVSTKGRAAVDKVRSFLVAVGTALANKKGGELNELFPAVAKLAGKGTKTQGMEDAVQELMKEAQVLANGKVWLRDGRSGQRFEFPITVGAIYMLKLSHLIDDKIHARSIGPYSLVTQQPLAGKAQLGGQRFGEMEVWALEAYGAAHTLQEMLTVKSDDVAGRSKVYEAIVKGENLPKPGIPESFNVLVKELQALGLAVELGEEE